MLKKDLENTCDRLQKRIDKLVEENRGLSLALSVKNDEIDAATSRAESYRDQMKKISQSIHTLLSVKYAESIYLGGEISGSGEDCDEKRALMFLHQLCADITPAQYR